MSAFESPLSTGGSVVRGNETKSCKDRMKNQSSPLRATYNLFHHVSFLLGSFKGEIPIQWSGLFLFFVREKTYSTNNYLKNGSKTTFSTHFGCIKSAYQTRCEEFGTVGDFRVFNQDRSWHAVSTFGGKIPHKGNAEGKNLIDLELVALKRSCGEKKNQIPWKILIISDYIIFKNGDSYIFLQQGGFHS